jgi:3D (Asp-Asp-Asp) domain-containing protein
MGARRLQGLVLCLLVLGAGAIGCGGRARPVPEPASQPDVGAAPDRGAESRMPFEATAYSIEGKTAAGTRTHEGVVAADPALLPLGTRIRVHDAGRYSGEYVVRDTGRTIKGREIDIYLSNDREAKRFGRKSVRVEVLAYGDGRAVKPTR